MSEYQNYEFAAIDRPLTRAEMAQLRAVSTRAEITPSGLVNHYEWGNLKADPADWTRRYIDAFVYTANWCSCQLALRLPLATVRKAELKLFSVWNALSIEAEDGYWLIKWLLDESENHDRFATEDGSGWIRRLVPLRDELVRGDLRPLYLGWLAAALRDELGDDALKPEVPPGLSELSPPQQALADFLEIDPDMLAAAIAGSGRVAQDDVAQLGHINAWLSEWSRDELAVVLKLIAQGQGQVAEGQIRSRHAAWLKARHRSSLASAVRRSVSQLRELAQSASGFRVEHEAQEHAKQEAKRRLQREAYPRRLMADVDKCWAAIDAHAQRGSASGYEQAVRALAEFADGYAFTSSAKEFDRALRRWPVRHATRGALMRRLTEAGLWSG